MFNFIKHRNISLLWLSQLLSQFGDRVAQMCLIGYAYQKSPGSTVALAIISSATLVPAFLISPFAGAYIDRWNKKFAILISELSRAFFMVLIPLFLLGIKHDFVPVYLVIFASFASACFLLPARLSTIPELVSKESLIITNSFFNATTAITIVTGFLFGGLLVEYGGLKAGFYITTLLFVLAAVVISFLRPSQFTVIDEGLTLYKQYISVGETVPKASILREIKEGLLHLFSEKKAFLVTKFITIIMISTGALYVLAVVFIQTRLNSATKHLGVMAVFLGAGFILGNIIYARLEKSLKQTSVIYGGIAITGILAVLFVILMNASPNIYIASVLIMGIGVVLGPMLVTINTIVHQDIEMRLQGRIFSWIGVLMNIAVFVSLFLGAWLGKLLSVAIALVAIGLVLVGYGLLMLYRDEKALE